ncbi:MAG: hypothetical protein OEV91_00040 [Desulfobulbaceae bacterium]|nr:hypothetical protein [Desulfobulbaceae bacterium]
MKIQFYRSIICPRCLLVSRTLGRLQTLFPDLEVETIEITTTPLRAWQDNIRMVPALKSGDAILSGIILTQERVREFIEEHVLKRGK